MRKQRFKPGDRVAYSRAWLRSIGAYTDKLPFARGTVTALTPLGETTLATVHWGDDDIPPRVNVLNLVKVDQIHSEGD